MIIRLFPHQPLVRNLDWTSGANKPTCLPCTVPFLPEPSRSRAPRGSPSGWRRTWDFWDRGRPPGPAKRRGRFR
jgi:hypothetical protein